MRVLVINCGSSSIKYQVFDREDYSTLTSGILERIGEANSQLRYRWRNNESVLEDALESKPVANHRVGLEHIMAITSRVGAIRHEGELFAIGHRVVHGGEAFHEPTLINEQVITTIRDMIPLAPLHNPANLMGIEISRELCPHVPQVAVFDTAFHQSMPPHAFHYALPYDLYTTYHIRRYGFHGTSHHYVAKQASGYLNKPLEGLNLITLHLGNGASATAIRSGRSIETSMGMTPLEGLVMGTRCGDLDPAIHFYLARVTGKSTEELDAMFNHESGLRGICGENDMREIIRNAESGDRYSQLAIDMFCYRIKKYIGAYCAILGRLDALVFTGGIGENAASIRKRSCEGLEGLGIIIDTEKNRTLSGKIIEVHAAGGAVKILVVPTDEELEIARQTVECIKGKGKKTE